MNDYDKGFQAGLIWCAKAIRLAARQVEEPRLGQFKTGDSDRIITAIAKSGQPRFAESLRAVARELESALGEPTNAKSGSTPVERIHETPSDGGQQKR